MQDVLNRPLKVGDLVLYNRPNIYSYLNYGIVVSEKSVFDGERNYHYVKQCLLVSNLDEIEQEKYEKLVSAYNLMESNKKKKKLRHLNQEEQVKYGLYRNGKTYYLYLGKMKYCDEFINNRKFENREIKFYAHPEGYAYLVITQYESRIRNLLKSMSIDLVKFMSYKESSGKINCRMNASSGYYDIYLSKKLVSYDEYLGQVQVDGLYEPGKLYLYGSLLNIYGNDLLVDNLAIYSRCILESLD